MIPLNHNCLGPYIRPGHTICCYRPGSPLPAVAPAAPLDEGGLEADAAVHNLLRAERLSVVHVPPEAREAVVLVAPVPQPQVLRRHLACSKHGGFERRLG